MSNLRWHIVTSKSGAEWAAYDNLLWKSIETYYPFEIRSSRRGHWKQGVVRPIYQGYLFAGLRPGQSVTDIERTPGVSKVLRNDGEIVLISYAQLATIKRDCSALYRSALPHRSADYRPHVGDVIKIPHGAFKGVPAIINAIDKSGAIGATIGNLEVTFHLSDLAKSERGSRNALSNHDAAYPQT